MLAVDVSNPHTVIKHKGCLFFISPKSAYQKLFAWQFLVFLPQYLVLFHLLFVIILSTHTRIWVCVLESCPFLHSDFHFLWSCESYFSDPLTRMALGQQTWSCCLHRATLFLFYWVAISNFIVCFTSSTNTHNILAFFFN